MKFKGKVGLWWHAVVLAALALPVYLIFFMELQNWSKVLILLIFVPSLIFMISCTVRNYVKLKDDHFVLYFSFFKTVVRYKDIVSIEKTNTMLAGSAASFDRLWIKTTESPMIISVHDKDRFIEEVMRRSKL